MKPQTFAEMNAVMKGNPETMDNVGELPVWTDKYEIPEDEPKQFVSCWRPSYWERIQILMSGKVWLHIHSHGQPPVYLDGNRLYFIE